MRKQISRLVAIFSVMFFVACGGRIELLRDISESEANEAMAALLDAGISSSKIPGKEGLVSLDVDQSKVAQAIAILNAEGLPRERFVKMGDVFRKEGLISSPLEERARYIWALSQELSATLSQIDGVIKARVHVVLPEKTGGGEPSLPSSAAVFIKHKQGVILDDSVAQIKRLVSNSIPGLSSDKVTVVMLPSIVQRDELATDRQTSAPVRTNNTERTSKWSAHIGILAVIVALISVSLAAGFLFWRIRKKRLDPKPANAPKAADAMSS